MSEHRYPSDSLTGDYLRAGAGLLLCGGPLIVVDVGFWPFLILGGLTALFGYFGLRTWLRHTTVVMMDETGITTRSSGPATLPWHAAAIPWQDLRRLKLSYFSTKRDKTGGWMQLSITGPRGKLQLDSAIDGFEDVARRAFEAARHNRVELSQATIGNLNALGITAGADDQSWGDPSGWSAPAKGSKS